MKVLSEEQVKKEVYTAYLNKTKDRFYGLLCEREKKGEWEKFLESLLIEIMGFEESARTINYYILYFKLSSLKYLRYDYFRKTIFECMNLVDTL